MTIQLGVDMTIQLLLIVLAFLIGYWAGKRSKPHPPEKDL